MMDLCKPSKFPLNKELSIEEISELMKTFEKDLEEQKINII
jgi:hypothetical protein